MHHWMARLGSRRSWQVGAILVVGCLVLFPSFWGRELWNPDEPRYAEVAREMNVLGEYLVPHLNGDIYSQKPPLFFWLSAALQPLFGFGAGRVVTALAFVGTLLLVRALARLWFSDRAAILAALVVGTTELFAWLGRFGVLDVPLSFFTTLAVYGFFRHRERGGRAIVLFYAGMALAVLTKGPVGLVVPLLAAGAGLASRDRARPLRLGHAAWGVPLLLAIVAAWVVPACLHGGREYAQAILLRQNVGRVVESWSHARPWWYYFPYLAANFFPWIFVAVPAAVWAWREGRNERALRTLLLWFALGFVFFSLVSGKRERYLLPLFPPLALLTGRFLDAGLPGRAAHRLFRAAHGAFILVGAGIVLFAAAGRFALEAAADRRPQVVEGLEPLTSFPAALLVALFGGALLALGRIGRREARREAPHAPVLLAAEVLLLLLTIDVLFVPRINDFKSPRPVALELNAYAPDEAAIYNDTYAGAYNLYTGRTRIEILPTPADVDAFLAKPGRRLCLTDRGAFARWLEGELKGRYYMTDVGRVGHREMVFLTNFSPPS